MRVKRAKSLSVQVLKALAVGAAIYLVLNSPHGTQLLLKGIKKEWKKKQARKTIDQLHQRKLVAYRFIDKQTMVIELTEAGKKRLLEYRADDIAPRIPKWWDRKWRIIFFDIPESHKKARDAFRAKFREWGLHPLQKSVFVYPYPCEDEIAIIRDLFHLPHKSLMIITTDRVGDQKTLKKLFDLR